MPFSIFSLQCCVNNRQESVALADFDANENAAKQYYTEPDSYLTLLIDSVIDLILAYS